MSLSNRLHFTAVEQELICDLIAETPQLNNDELLYAECQVLARILAERYEQGNATTLQDQNKASKYKKIVDPTYKDPADEYTLFGIHGIFVTIHRFFTWARLILVRFSRFISIVNQEERSLVLELPIIKALGFSYGIELAWDLSMICYDVFQPELGWHELTLSRGARYLQRAQIAFSDAERLNRMSTDSIWFTISMLNFILFGPLALFINPIINCAGNGFDVIHDGVFGWLSGSKYNTLLGKIDDQRENNNKEIAKLDNVLNIKIKREYPSIMNTAKCSTHQYNAEEIATMRELAPARENRLISNLRERLHILKQEQVALDKLSLQVDNKIRDIEKTTIRTMIGAALIMLGALLLAPTLPAVIAGAALSVAGIVGVSLAIVGGTLLRGIGPWLFQKVSEGIEKFKEFRHPPSFINPEIAMTSLKGVDVKEVPAKGGASNIVVVKEENSSYFAMQQHLKLDFRRKSQVGERDLIVNDKIPNTEKVKKVDHSGSEDENYMKKRK